MILKPAFRQQPENRILRLALVVVMLFAVWHIAMHDIDLSDDLNGSVQCVYCNLNHIPITDLPILSWNVPLILLTLVLIVSSIQHVTKFYFYTSGARAPPLS